MTIKQILKSRKIRSFLMQNLGFIPDSLYVRLFYFVATGKWPNLKNPVGYNEKLQWLKLHDKHPEYSILVDKLRVRDVIKEKLGDGYMFPLLGHWEKFDDIDFSALPNEFVLKCNHDSGSVKIIKDKESFSKEDFQKLKQFYDRRVRHNFFYAGREYQYKNVKPYIIAEQLMHDESDALGGIKDYKFLCFSGKPEFMISISGRQTEKHEDYFDMEYNWTEIYNGSTPSAICPPKPACFEEMKRIATELCQGFKQVRIDLFEINGKVYFGEYTIFSGGGFEIFKPDKWEKQFGDWIKL